MYEGMLKSKIEEKEGESSSVGVTEVVDPVKVEPVVEQPERRIAPLLLLACGGVMRDHRRRVARARAQSGDPFAPHAGLAVHSER